MLSLSLAFALFSGSARASAVVSTKPPFRYSSAVSFSQGKCRYWTGDVMFDAAEYRDDLKRRLETKLGMTIFHAAGVPAKCVMKARMLAKQAGFRDVDDKTGGIDLGLP